MRAGLRAALAGLVTICLLPAAGCRMPEIEFERVGKIRSQSGARAASGRR